MGNCSSQGAKLSVQKFFKATILSSYDLASAEELGAGNLEVTKYELVLHRRGMQTQRWPYIFLTRCDYKGSVFRIETKNPHVSENRVEHIFKVKHANLLLQRIQAQVIENSLTNKSATVTGSKHSLTTSDSESIAKENIDPDGVIYPSRMKNIELELEAPLKHNFANIPQNIYSRPPQHFPQPSQVSNLQQMQQQHLQQQRLQHQYQQPQQMFYQQQMHQLTDFIHSRNTLNSNNIYTALNYNPPRQPIYSKPDDFIYEQRHLANNQFAKDLRNNDLKRKHCRNEVVIGEESDDLHSNHQTKLCKKRSAACKRQNKVKRLHHNRNSYNNFNDSDDMSIIQQSELRRKDVERSIYRSLDMLDVGRGNHNMGPIHYL